MTQEGILALICLAGMRSVPNPCRGAELICDQDMRLSVKSASMNKPRSDLSTISETQWLACRCSSEKIGESCSGLRFVEASLDLSSLLCLEGEDRILLVMAHSMYDLGLKVSGHGILADHPIVSLSVVFNPGGFIVSQLTESPG